MIRAMRQCGLVGEEDKGEGKRRTKVWSAGRKGERSAGESMGKGEGWWERLNGLLRFDLFGPSDHLDQTADKSQK
ncbi:hypothetical protein HAX54_001228 [Datura stramonium]|uniref:Uncharacterized protein n=1 Tax=Datura stramonium TaxID=4076 RepID=A0ABS8T232_DATST|nr:hypothetical protein [Datura stramonium]